MFRGNQQCAPLPELTWRGDRATGEDGNADVLKRPERSKFFLLQEKISAWV